MRIAALFFGLVAGLFALLAPSALRTDLMSPFLELWSASPSERTIGTIIWYAIPAAAIAGGVLATIMPGLAALPLAAAAMGWISIGLALPELFDFKLLAPAAGAGLAAVLALGAAELATRRRRMRRRQRRSLADMAPETDEIEREAALRMSPLAIARDTVPPQPSRVVPLTLDDVAVKSERPSGPPPRWQDLDAPSQRPGRLDIWGEAIRPEPERGSEPEHVPAPGSVAQEPEFDIEREPAQARGFRWDRADAPVGHTFEPGGRAGPRLVPRPPPTIEPRAEPAARRAPEPLSPVRPAPVPKPDQMRADADSWPQARSEQRWAPPDEPVRRGRGGLVAALSAVVTVLVLGIVAVGGYLAYRDGWVDRLTGSAQGTGQESGAAQVPGTIPESPGQRLAGPATPEPATVLPALPTAPTLQATTPAAQPVADLAGTTAVAQRPAAPPYTDPFSYCRAVSTADYVDDRYGGPMVIPAMTQALAVPDSASRDRVHWRCADGAVLACASYIGPVCDMAPSLEEMRGYCERYKSAPQLMAPGGTWSCVDGRARLPADAAWPVDARGFRADAWVVVTPPAAPAG